MTGGNTSGFKSFKDSYHHFAMGIAEIAADGTFVITKQPNSNGFNGMVTDVTVRSQILYEIQGNVSASRVRAERARGSSMRRRRREEGLQLESGEGRRHGDSADPRSTSTPTCRAFWTTSR